MFKKSFLKKNHSIVIVNKTLQNSVKQGSVYYLLCPKQGLKIEGGVLHRVYILGFFCPKQGQGLKPSAAPLYPAMGQVPPPPPAGSLGVPSPRPVWSTCNLVPRVSLPTGCGKRRTRLVDF